MGENKTTSNQRGNIRHPVEVPILLINEDGSTESVTSGNVSDCGLYVTIHVDKRPPLQSTVKVQVQTPMGDGGEAPINNAVVVRYDPSGVGLKFIFDD